MRNLQSSSIMVVYGSLEDFAHRTQTASLRADKAEEEVEPADGRRHVQLRSASSTSRREWLTIAVICCVGVSAIMATSRNARSPASGGTVWTTSTQAGPVSGSLPVEKLPASATQPSFLDEHDKTPLHRAAVQSNNQQQTQQQRPGEGVANDEGGALDFSMTNFYHSRDGKPGAQIPWLQGVKLAEPFRDTTVTVTAPRKGHSYRWEIRNTDIDEEERQVMATASGTEVTIKFTKLDYNDVVLMEVDDASGAVVRELQEAVMVKYVRREIRTLTLEEREELLDSMLKLWTVRAKGGNGKELYGEDYADIWAINRLHFEGSSPMLCDHIHDGLGFLTSHSLLTNTFEYSLQRVNPKLTVPYWDFTIEQSTFGGKTDDIVENQANSPLLTPDWFGSRDVDDCVVKDGRWAYTEIPRTTVNNPSDLEVDVYSKLRSPWNVNDRPYLARGLGDMCGVRSQSYWPWPTCETHYDLSMYYNDFYSWVWQSLYTPHGSVHIWLGGVMDCEETFAKIADLVGKDIAEFLAYYSVVHRKNMFRDGIWSCEGTTGIDTAPEEVMKSKQCGCLNYNLESGDDYLAIRNTMVLMTDLIQDFDADTQRRVISTLCTGLMNDGDHLQSSSSLDPTFWVTHPTMERLWMFKRLTGTLTDITWPDTDTTYTNDDGEQVSEVLSLYSGTCVGHRGSDVFPFGFGEDPGSPTFETRTGIKDDMETDNQIPNRQILQMLDPRENGLNYIYDTFEWKHCTADGYDFNDVWKSDNSSVKGGRPTFKEGKPRYPLYSKLQEDLRRFAASA